MKSKILWLLIISGSVSAQAITGSVKYNLDKIHFIKMDLPGRITISNTSENQMNFDYQVSTSGKIIGWSNKGDSLLYKPILKIVGDTLSIVSRKNFWAVGFSSYAEDVSQIIYIPEAIALMVEARGELNISGFYKKIDVRNSNSTILNIAKDQIRELKCQVIGGQLKFNGQNRMNSFEFQGSGEAVYFIRSKNIFINLK